MSKTLPRTGAQHAASVRAHNRAASHEHKDNPAIDVGSG